MALALSLSLYADKPPGTLLVPKCPSTKKSSRSPDEFNDSVIMKSN